MDDDLLSGVGSGDELVGGGAPGGDVLLAVLIISDEGGEEVGGLGRSGEREEVAEGDGRGLEGAVGEGKEGGEAGMEENHKESARDMFEKITDYLNGELAGWYMLTLCMHTGYRPLYYL